MRQIILFSLILLLGASFGNERKFSYTYQSGVLGKGNKELEVWSTLRIGKDIPYFVRFDHRFEFELGVSDRLQTAFYFNFRNISIDDGNGMKTGFDFEGISSEWKYQFTKPAKDPIGFALYAELGLNTDEAGIETKLIFDKRADKHTFALNFVYENEWQLSSAKGGSESTLEGDFGWCYDFSPIFSAGIELRNHNEIVEGEWEHSALFAGPVLSYSQPAWWATLSVMPQIAALKGKTGSSNLVLDEHEKLETRLLFSFRL